MGCGAEHVFPAIHRVYRSWRLKVPSAVPKTTPTATSMVMLSFIAPTATPVAIPIGKASKVLPVHEAPYSIRFQSSQSDGEFSFRLRPEYDYQRHKLNAPNSPVSWLWTRTLRPGNLSILLT